MIVRREVGARRSIQACAQRPGRDRRWPRHARRAPGRDPWAARAAAAAGAGAPADPARRVWRPSGTRRAGGRGAPRLARLRRRVGRAPDRCPRAGPSRRAAPPPGRRDRGRGPAPRGGRRARGAAPSRDACRDDRALRGDGRVRPARRGRGDGAARPSRARAGIGAAARRALRPLADRAAAIAAEAAELARDVAAAADAVDLDPAARADAEERLACSTTCAASTATRSRRLSSSERRRPPSSNGSRTRRGSANACGPRRPRRADLDAVAARLYRRPPMPRPNAWRGPSMPSCRRSACRPARSA